MSDTKEARILYCACEMLTFAFCYCVSFLFLDIWMCHLWQWKRNCFWRLWFLVTFFHESPYKFTYAHGSCRSHKWRKKMVSEYFRSPRTLYFVICGPWIDKLVQNILAKGEGKWLFWLQNSSEKFISLVSALLVFYQLGLVEKGPNRTRPYFAFALANSWTKKKCNAKQFDIIILYMRYILLAPR